MEHDVLVHCKYFYEAFFIPIYVYERRELIGCFPEQNPLFCPPKNLIQEAYANSDTIGYLSGSSFAYVGYLCVKDAPEYRILVGPVSGVPYEKTMMRTVLKHYGVPTELEEDASSFFRNIPLSILSNFLGKLLLMNHVINKEDRSFDSLFSVNFSQSSAPIRKEQTENVYAVREEIQFNNSYEVEKLILSFVADGNIEGFDKFLKTPMNIQTGSLANDNIRQLKNTFIVTLALITRTVIQAGVESEIAFQLSDLYIKQVEQMTKSENIPLLQLEAIHTFTSKVAEYRFPSIQNSDIRMIIHHIQRHVDRALTVDSIAEELRFNRSYLSYKFHKETGMKLHAFIQECKVQEAKRLLTFTAKSLSEISNYLCFSSQSHFQNVFKKAEGITPLQYRKRG